MATKRQQDIQDRAKIKKATEDQAAADKKYQDSYLAFLDDKTKKEGQSFKNWERAQDRKQKKLKEEEAQTKKQAKEEAEIIKLKKQGVSQGKKTRDLARDHSKFLKSNTGSLLQSLGIVHDTNAIGAGAAAAAKAAAKETDTETKKKHLADQEGWNQAGEARKQAMSEIEQGTFDAQTYSENLANTLPEGMSQGAIDSIKNDAKVFGKSADEIIGDDPDAFADKMTLSKEAMSSIDGFKDKIFKAKSFITDPKFRGMMLKGMFIGLAVKAAAALGEALKAGFDFAREMGISLSSMPLMVGFAKDEASALLNEFGSLKDVTNENLIAMKWNAYWYGVAGADSAKLAKLQMSITDSSLEMALEDQSKFMKELAKEGLSASKVMSDMASHSEFIAKYMKDGGDNMEAAAKQAASMGVSLDHSEAIANKLMDWESSIAAEMEASVLLGRQLNLDKARQLAYDGKIAEMLVEAKIQAGGEAEFAKMTVVQREALGDALGLNAVQMAEMVRGQEGAADASEKVKWAWIGMGALVGGVVGLMAGLIPALIGSIPGMQKFGFKQAAKGLAVGIGTGVAGAAAGGILGAGASAGAGAMGRATGGPVKAGSPYVVGEKRPELFIPSQTGHILPNVPQMSTGNATFSAIEGREIITELKRSNDLKQQSIIQADTLSRKGIRATENIGANR